VHLHPDERLPARSGGKHNSKARARQSVRAVRLTRIEPGAVWATEPRLGAGGRGGRAQTSDAERAGGRTSNKHQTRVDHDGPARMSIRREPAR
jgi:hypothetical protein